MLTGADLLVLLTDTGGLYTADPRVDPGATLVDRVEDPEALGVLEIGHATSPLGSGGMRSKVVAADMATSAGIATVIASGLEPGVDPARVGGRGGRHALRAAAEPALELQAVAQVRQAGPGDAVRRRRRRAGAARGRHVAAAGRASSRSTARFDAGDAVEVREAGDRTVGKGICNYSAAELRRVIGRKSAEVREVLPRATEEAVHRDYFVLA